MNQPEDYPGTIVLSRDINQYQCPRCGGPVLRPSPAMMEDDDWRYRCQPCLRRWSITDCRVAWLREHTEQREHTKSLPEHWKES